VDSFIAERITAAQAAGDKDSEFDADFIDAALAEADDNRNGPILKNRADKTPRRETPREVSSTCAVGWEPFPTGCLPDPAAELVGQGADALGCDPAMVGVPILVALAASVGLTRAIELKSDWRELPVLWGGIVAPPSTLKTPVLNMVLNPLREAQHHTIARFREEFARFEDDRRRFEALDKDRKIHSEPPERPVCMRYLADDFTVESLAPVLQENPRGLLVDKDELSGLVEALDSYKGGRGGDGQRLLTSWSAGPWTIDRKRNRELIAIPRAGLWMLGGIQPETLWRVLGGRHVEDGFLARIALTMPPLPPSGWRDAEVSEAVLRTYAALIERLLAIPVEVDGIGRIHPRPIPLEADARRRFADWVNRHGERIDSEAGALRAALGKIRGMAARVALVLQQSRVVLGDAASDAVDEAAVQAGTTIADWLANEAQRVYGRRHPDDQRRLDLADQVARRGRSMTPRELARSSRAFSRSGAAEAALQELVDAGLGRWSSEPSGVYGGRPSRRFILTARADATPP